MADPIVIWGAGAIGGTLGAHLVRAGHEVLLVDTVAEHVEACRTKGLTISGPVTEFTQIIPAVTPAKLTGRYSRIVLAVKAQATKAALPILAPHLAPDGFVFSAQNGLNEIEIAEAVGAERTMGCFVKFGADWHAPGQILFGNRGAFVVGEIDGTIRRRIADHIIGPGHCCVTEFSCRVRDDGTGPRHLYAHAPAVSCSLHIQSPCGTQGAA